MRRRNADFCGKFRRPVKKSKLTSSGFYGSTFMYLKFLMVWSFVLFADFILEFRFEYLWPFWLLIRSVYDSFKYQGLAFSVFFVFIALTSDMICFLLIPVHWLFFVASTYVWVQYVWHTEKGICLPTLSLWLLFVYIEASFRLKELKNLPFHLDLCRPFAAHCIGYSVVTLGFGFKSHVSYKMRLRKQSEVAKENEFYFELLQKALPQETCATNLTDNTSVISNCVPLPLALNHNHHSLNNKKAISGSSNEKTPTVSHNSSNISKLNNEYDSKKSYANGIDKQELQFMENPINKKPLSEYENDSNISDCNHEESFKNLTSSLSPNKSTEKLTNSMASISLSSSNKLNHSSNHVTSSNSNANSLPFGNVQSLNISNKKTKNNLANNLTSQKDELVIRLEADIKRLKAYLQASRQTELELKSQINSLLSEERSLKSELSTLQQDNDSLQTRLHNLLSARQQDKQTVSQLEKRLQEEKKSRASYESQLASERKAKKDEANARAAAAAARIECTEICKNKRRELESELKLLRKEIKVREDQVKQIDCEAQSLRQYKESHGDTEILLSALSAMQDKNAHLENSLSAETRLKLDLFSALGEAKRQLEINQGKNSLLQQKERQIEELESTVDQLKARFTELLAVMPATNAYTGIDSDIVSSLMLNSKFMPDPNDSHESSMKSPLDPNAPIYTPKSPDL
ncbi:macoilin isoform X1 [Tetranychus urticae]|uniref:macoilin isoform X1 n=1 Tax=Tetranychus urticae TaxID=32264 RepID=UPI00077BA957|nr:macoilin isoform X1 [Tetranychus urticae]